MKFKFSALILLSVLFFTQCEKTKVDNSSFTIDDVEYSIQHATVADLGTNMDLTHREYFIEFTNADISTPKTYFNFKIKSTSTSRLEEGVYQYSYAFGDETFSYTNAGYNLSYDSKGIIIDGTILSETTDDTGSMTISKDDDTGNYVFDIDLVMHKNGIAYNVTGHINLALTEYKK